MNKNSIESQTAIPRQGMAVLQNYPALELYRLVVDGKLHREERGWRSYEAREPGCLKAFFHAMALAVTCLEDQLTVDFIRQLHFACTSRVPSLQGFVPGEFRKSDSIFLLDADNVTEAGLVELLKYVNHYKKYGCRLALLTQDGIPLEKVAFCENESDIPGLLIEIKEHDCFRRHCQFYTPSAKIIENMMQALVAGYNRAIVAAKDADARLRVIIRFIYEFEHLHPFTDANVRTFCILLLARLLLQNGFPPPTFYNPNCFDAFSQEELFSEIKWSMEISRKIAAGEKIIFGFGTADMPVEYQQRWLETVSEFRQALDNECRNYGNDIDQEPVFAQNSRPGNYLQLASAISRLQLHEKEDFFDKHHDLVFDGYQLARVMEVFPLRACYALAAKYRSKIWDCRELALILNMLAPEQRLLFIEEFNCHEFITNGSELAKILKVLPQSRRRQTQEMHSGCIRTVFELAAVARHLPQNQINNFFFDHVLYKKYSENMDFVRLKNLAAVVETFPVTEIIRQHVNVIGIDRNGMPVSVEQTYQRISALLWGVEYSQRLIALQACSDYITDFESLGDVIKRLLPLDRWKFLAGLWRLSGGSYLNARQLAFSLLLPERRLLAAHWRFINTIPLLAGVVSTCPDDERYQLLRSHPLFDHICSVRDVKLVARIMLPEDADIFIKQHVHVIQNISDLCGYAQLVPSAIRANFVMTHPLSSQVDNFGELAELLDFFTGDAKLELANRYAGYINNAERLVTVAGRLDWHTRRQYIETHDCYTHANNFNEIVLFAIAMPATERLDFAWPHIESVCRLDLVSEIHIADMVLLYSRLPQPDKDKLVQAVVSMIRHFSHLKVLWREAPQLALHMMETQRALIDVIEDIHQLIELLDVASNTVRALEVAKLCWQKINTMDEVMQVLRELPELNRREFFDYWKTMQNAALNVVHETGRELRFIK